MNVLWIKDNNIGHEKQVRVLLEELSKQITLDIDERSCVIAMSVAIMSAEHDWITGFVS